MLFNKKNKVKLLKSPLVSYESLPFEQIKDQMIYSFYDLVFKNDAFSIYTRINKNYLHVVYFIEDINIFKNFDFNTLDEYFDLELFDFDNQITVYLCKTNNLEAIEFAHKNHEVSEFKYKIALLYNNKEHKLEEYVKLKKNKTSYFEYVDLVIKGLGCKDFMEVE